MLLETGIKMTMKFIREDMLTGELNENVLWNYLNLNRNSQGYGVDYSKNCFAFEIYLRKKTRPIYYFFSNQLLHCWGILCCIKTYAQPYFSTKARQNITISHCTEQSLEMHRIQYLKHWNPWWRKRPSKVLRVQKRYLESKNYIVFMEL